MSMEKEIGAEEKTEGVNASVEEKKERREAEKQRDEKITDFGQTVLNKEEPGKRIHLLSIIGEIEGHECSAQNMKTTKYEHVIPQLIGQFKGFLFAVVFYIAHYFTSFRTNKKPLMPKGTRDDNTPWFHPDLCVHTQL